MTAQAPKLRVITVNRYRGVADGTECGCKSGHITEDAAIRCMKSKATTQPTAAPTARRYWGTVDGKVRCDHRDGHGSEAIAQRCSAKLVKAQPAKPAQPAPRSTRKPAVKAPAAAA